MNVRGHERRKEICERYKVTPVYHGDLVADEVKSDAGPILTAEYYCFLVYDRDTGTRIDSIICGMDAAADILKLTGAESLPKADLLMPGINAEKKPEPKEKAEDKPKEEQEPGEKAQKEKKPYDLTLDLSAWHPAARQLYEAVSLLTACWGSRDTGVLYDVLAKIRLHPDMHPGYLCKSVNTMIAKDAYGRTLGLMIKQLRKKQPTLKWFDFKDVNAYLEKKGIESKFG